MKRLDHDASPARRSCVPVVPGATCNREWTQNVGLDDSYYHHSDDEGADSAGAPLVADVQMAEALGLKVTVELDTAIERTLRWNRYAIGAEPNGTSG